MTINSTTYKLSEKNYYISNFEKKQIVIGHSFSGDMSFINGWLKRLGGEYKKVTPYTIDLDGKVYEHYPPNNHSDYIGYDPHDKKIIPITLVNEGWLLKDCINNKFLDWKGHIYNREDKVVERRWRNHTHWSPYSEKQMNSLIKLIKKLCNDFNIQKKVIGHNTQVHYIDKFEGIVFKSNYNKNVTDLSPSFDYNKLKQTIENE